MTSPKKCILAFYGFGLNDPPIRQTAKALTDRGFRVVIVHTCYPEEKSTTSLDGITSIELRRIRLPGVLSAFANWLNWARFKRLYRGALAGERPDIIVTFMLHPLTALPPLNNRRSSRLISCIYDIPAGEDAGRLDRTIHAMGWRRLKESAVVWSSDIYKARLTQKLGGLSAEPLVCHNCPTLNYLPEPTWPRDPWLREELKRQGAPLGSEGGCILLRAGAVGECGGIEETLEGMAHLPDDYVFVMMGRPVADYKRRLLDNLTRLGLKKRAFFWDRPSDEVWLKALQGADAGHLIHGPFPPGRMTRLYELNSSLSNNRLFQYMAAGLPIISYDDPRMKDIYREVPCFKVARLACLKEDVQQAWRELGEEAGLRVRLGRAGREAHRNKYHWECQFAPVLDRITA